MGRPTAHRPIAAIALAFAASLAFTSCAAPAPKEPAPPAAAEPAPTEPAPTSDTTALDAAKLNVADLEVPAGLDAEQLGTLIVADRFTAWNNAGADPELNKRSVADNVSWELLLPQLAEQNKQAFAEALYIEGWEQDPELTQYVNGSKEANLNTLKWYASTQWSGDEKPENVEGYRTWKTIDSVIEVIQDTDDRMLNVNFTSHDNADKNTAPDNPPQVNTYTITLRTVGDVEKIVAIYVT